MSAAPMIDMNLATDPSLPDKFLGHLASLAARQAASPSAKERAALSVAMFSVFLDCVTLGVADKAQVIMSQLHTEAPMERIAA